MTNLGMMHFNGDAIKRDYVQAYKWFYLAENSDGLARLTASITHEQIAEAQRLVQEWLEAHPRR